MKNILLTLAYSALLFSCCQKKDCVFLEERPLVFNGFSKAELDTVLIVRYEPRTGFSKVIDSSTTAAADGYIAYPLISLSRQQYAYKVLLPAAGKTYLIDDFGYNKIKNCNSCFPTRPKSEYIDEFSSYTLNRERRSGKFITIDK